MRERSSITPMKMNSGMASSTSLVMHAEDALRQRAEEREVHHAGSMRRATAKPSDTPPSVSATG